MTPRHANRPRQLVVGVVQTNSQDDKNANIAEVLAGIDRAARMGAQFVSLPETWTHLGRSRGDKAAAEMIPGELTDMLADKAREHSIWLHAGSMLEKVDEHDKLYNTTVVFDPVGDVVARYRKIHLFDVDLAGQASFRESDTIEPGDEIVTFDLNGTKVGLAICYDLRFPELFRILALEGAEVIMLPAAFTMATGKDHWETLIRARAIENSVFMVAPAQVGDHPPGRQCYGRSMVVDPWGVVLAQAGDIPTVITATLEMDEIARVRGQVPSLKNRMPERYSWPEPVGSYSVSD
jgi:deaminated glutathione amidase